MTVTGEIKAELRRLHAEMVNLHAAFLVTEDADAGLAAMSAADDFRELAGCLAIFLLDALAAAEADLAHREAQLNLTQEHLARAHETIKRMEGERDGLLEERSKVVKLVAEWRRQVREEKPVAGVLRIEAQVCRECANQLAGAFGFPPCP